MAESLLRGFVTKLVRVGVSESPTGTSRNGLCHQGYGLLRTEFGDHVYFVDTAVAENAFTSLRLGDEVLYHLEQGPLSRATVVRQVDHAENSDTMARTSSDDVKIGSRPKAHTTEGLDGERQFEPSVS